MDISKKDISIKIPSEWIASVSEAAKRFNSFESIILSHIEVKDGVLSLCAADTSSFLQWLPETLSEFEGYKLKSLLLKAIKATGAKKRTKQIVDYYEFCSNSTKGSKPNFSRELRRPPGNTELEFAE